MSIDAINEEEKAKLIQLVNEGCLVLQEVEDLKGGLRDTVRAIAEENGIKIYNYIIEVASGKKTKSEENGYGDDEFNPWVIGATL